MARGFREEADGLLPSFAVGSRVAQYRLEKRVGAGGMAVVFRAWDEGLVRKHPEPVQGDGPVPVAWAGVVRRRRRAP